MAGLGSSGVPDAHYTDPRLVQLYDPQAAGRRDLDLYVALAGDRPARVLDLGCGTGEFAARLAAAGHRVTGVDPAEAMLEVARRRGTAVQWRSGDARALDLGAGMEGAFDLVVLTGHTVQVFVTDADLAAVLATARRYLRPGGRLAFETGNPAVRAWESWTPDDPDTVDPVGTGPVTVVTRVLAVDGDLVTFEQAHEFARTGERLVSRSTLRFLDEPALRHHLAAAGFGDVQVYGDWDRSPVTPRSRELIVVAS